MKADTNEMVPEEGTSILQLERPLLPIDKYAAREGLTRAVVEECGRLGIVQLRKYKGKTYVVDVPLSPYHPACEGAPILQEIHNIATQANPKSTGGGQTINKTTPAPKILGSAQTGTAVAHKVAPFPSSEGSKGATLNIGPPKTETMSTLAKSMFCKASQIKKQLMEKIKHQTTENFQFPISNFQIKNRKSKIDNQKIDDLRLPIADFKSKIENQKLVVSEAEPSKIFWAVSLMVCVFVAFLTALWLYMNQRVHRSRLDQASASIQNVYDDFVRTSQQLATFQSKQVESTAELEWIKNELNNSKAATESVQAEIKSLRHEITKVRQGLEAIQQHNIAAIEQLKEQFQQLTDQLSEFIKNNQTSSDR